MLTTGAIALTPTFRFDAGAFSLEFLLSGAVDPWEQLHQPADLAAWIGRSSLGVTEPVAVEEGDLEAAKRLRSAVQTLAEAAVAGEALPGAAVEVLNAFAAAPTVVPVLGAELRRGWASPVTATQYLSAVARDGIDLFGGSRLDRVRMCAGDRCALIFYDTSRPGARRWCSMDRCGNRSKLKTRRGRATITP
ncbi:CGNR zinc finger domain-containing protein [Nonomuraea sp. NPDC050556]|uniref:CGNR zinc finger domain-containing protein n=1 Tax=Nonomuraea sp. NPDC050556 TaxID=3364369 RepID=UPI0037B1C912